MLDGVKDHVKKHAKIYWSTSIFAAVSITYVTTCVMTRTRYAGPLEQILIRPFNVIGVNRTYMPIINLNTNRPGPLAYAVQKVGSDLKWNTQGEMALAEGLSKSNISNYFNHGVPLPNGENYVRIAATR